MRKGGSRILTSLSVIILGASTALAAIQPTPGPVIVPPTTPAISGGTPAPTPFELSAIYEIGIGLADVQAYAVTRRLSELRGPQFALEIPLEGKGPDHKQVIETDGKTMLEFKGTPPIAPESRWGGFLSGSATRLDLEDSSRADGYGISMYGVTLGIDYRVSDRLTLGVLIGYANSDVDLHRGDISANTGTLGLYGSWVDQGFYVNGLVAGSYSSYDIERRGIGGAASGDTEGLSFSGLLSTGYDFRKRGWTFGPFVDVQYTSVQFDGFREHGSDFPLVIEDNRSDSLRSRLGARISRCFQLGHILVCPEMGLSWQHEYFDRSRPTDAHFARGSRRSFRVEGPRMGRDGLVVNGAVTFLHNDRWSTYLAYDAVLGRDGYEAHTISGGVRVNF
jgi:outer membrane autotransporter protein